MQNVLCMSVYPKALQKLSHLDITLNLTMTILDWRNSVTETARKMPKITQQGLELAVVCWGHFSFADNVFIALL
jgi:hypothetical protein